MGRVAPHRKRVFGRASRYPRALDFQGHQQRVTSGVNVPLVPDTTILQPAHMVGAERDQRDAETKPVYDFFLPVCDPARQTLYARFP